MRRGVSDGAVLAVVASVLGLAALLWLWGGIAGALFGSGWPHVGAGELAGTALRLPTRLDDPAAAWPPGARPRLPGATGFYGALAVLATAAITTARAGASLARHRRHPGAHWARTGELRSLRGLRRRQGRLILGRHSGRPLYAEQRHALIVFGPPQSGKSSGLAIPALLEWPGPAVASSIKTDLLAATITNRSKRGSVFVFDPFGLADTPSHTWSPLHQAHTWDGALEVAWRLAGAGELDHRGVEGGDFWAIAAEQRLAPLLYTAAASGLGIDTVIRWTYGQGGRELHEALGALMDDVSHQDAGFAYDAVRSFEAQADRTRSSIEATAQALLRAYRFTRVARSARSSEITAGRLIDESATLYLICDAKASKLLRPIFLALLGEVVDHAYERATRNGGRLEQPLLLCLDEAGNVAPLPALAEIASTAPSHNIQLVSVFHDLAQARSRYRQQTETVVNSHRARMLLPGIADLETLRYFSSLLGEEDARELTRTTGTAGTSRSTGARRRPLLAPEALRQLPDGEALLLYGRLAPTRVKLRLWWGDRRLRRLAAA